MNSIAGHNQPPSLIEFSAETADALSDWLKQYPVIETEEASREAKRLHDRASDCLNDMEMERKVRVKPHQEKIDLINGEYRSPRSILEKIRKELLGRLAVWRKNEQEKKDREAEEARKRAEADEQAARDAEIREQAAQEDAALGAEVDLAPLTREADALFSKYEASARAAVRAERARNVKIGGGYRPALGASRFETKTLVVKDANAALKALGWSERLLKALESDARAFHNRLGIWPPGIEQETRSR